MKNNFFATLKKYRHAWAFSYFALYLSWYIYLERTITAKSAYHIMHSALDDYIPFNEYFIIPYYIWFLYVAGLVFFFFFKDKAEFYRYILFLAAGMSISLFICQIYPNGTDFRPVLDTNKNWATKLVSLIYASDTPTNVFPSIHVYNSLGTHLAIVKSKHFAHHPKLKVLSAVIAISICMSTVFLKQHSIIDVTGATILCYFAYALIYSHAPAYQEQTEKETSQIIG